MSVLLDREMRLPDERQSGPSVPVTLL